MSDFDAAGYAESQRRYNAELSDVTNSFLSNLNDRLARYQSLENINYYNTTWRDKTGASAAEGEAAAARNRQDIATMIALRDSTPRVPNTVEISPAAATTPPDPIPKTSNESTEAIVQTEAASVDPSTLPTTSSFMTADASTKISEMSGNIGNVFGGSGPFASLGANLPTFSSLKTSEMITGSSLFGGSGKLVNQAIDEDAARLAGTFSASAAKTAAGVSTINQDHIVKLREIGNKASDGLVVFEVMPEIVEARTVEYEAVTPAQFPGAFQKYKGTAPVQWTINAMFMARTSEEATANLHYLNRLRGWSMPYFGENTASQYPKKLGAPPPVLELSGLRKSIIGPVSVVITSLNWVWPSDVDYLPTNDPDGTGNLIPFPSVMTIAIQCVESWSITQFNQFKLSNYKNGDMFGAFNTALNMAAFKSSSEGSVVAGTAATSTSAVADSDVSGDSIRTARLAIAPPMVSGDSIRTSRSANVIRAESALAPPRAEKTNFIQSWWGRRLEANKKRN